MNCKFVLKAKNDQKIQAKMEKHFKKKHEMLQMPNDLKQRLQTMIRDAT